MITTGKLRCSWYFSLSSLSIMCSYANILWYDCFVKQLVATITKGFSLNRSSEFTLWKLKVFLRCDAIRKLCRNWNLQAADKRRRHETCRPYELPVFEIPSLYKCIIIWHKRKYRTFLCNSNACLLLALKYVYTAHVTVISLLVCSFAGQLRPNVSYVDSRNFGYNTFVAHHYYIQ